MWDRYRDYLETAPEQTFEWHDPPTGARGWLVINSLRGGAAGGGTRMRTGLTREEVVYLAKTMELKFAFSGPPVGGAKSGIAFDPTDPRRREVLQRWFQAVQPFLRSCYGTGGDVNVDEQKDVVPLCTVMGLQHPQEGIVRGHLKPGEDDLARILRQLRAGLEAPVVHPDLAVGALPFSVSDLITGYGVAEATRHLFALRGESIEGKRVTVEGFGNVGAACALYLARAGALLVGLVDVESAIIAPEGLRGPDLEALLGARGGRMIPEHPLRVSGPARAAVYDQPADVFIPAAISGSIDEARLEQLERAGVRTIVCGANQPFHEARLGDTLTQRRADDAFEIVADAIGSMGMARTFGYLMGDAPSCADIEIFEAVRQKVHETLEGVVNEVGERRTGLLAAAIGLAMEQSST